MKILVTGACGYIGSHCVKALLEAKKEVVALDDLSHGFRQAIPSTVPFVQADVGDNRAVTSALEHHKPDAVIHFAAFIEAGESVVDPRKYFENNFEKTLSFLGSMLDAKIKRLIFSSTAAVYGNPPKVPILEDFPLQPINPYGVSKLMVEQVLREYCRAYGFGAIAMRYFNVAGAHPDGSIGEAHEPESHLIPRILQSASGPTREVAIFGTDYPTADGTCVRDYVHVCDLVDAHLLALESIVAGQFEAFNVGSESGFSVREVIEAAQGVVGHPLKVVEKPRRPGDPASLIASSRKIRKAGWIPRYPDIKTMIAHAWAWHRAKPQGYRS